MSTQDVKPKQRKAPEESMAISAARQIFLILFVGWIVMRLSISKDPLPEEIKVADIDLEIALDEEVEGIQEPKSAPEPQVDEAKVHQQPEVPESLDKLTPNETSDIPQQNISSHEDNKTDSEQPDKQYTWGPWSPWSQCSVTCDGGVRVRSRRCYHVTWSSPRVVAFDLCEGDAIEEDSCLLSLCPNDKAERPNGPRETICDDSDGGGTDGADGDYNDDYQCPDPDDFGENMGEGEGEGGRFGDEAYMDGERIGGDGDDIIEEKIEAAEARNAQAERGDQMNDDGPGDADANADAGDGIYDADGDGIPDDIDADADGDGIPDDINNDGVHDDVDGDGDGHPDNADGDGNYDDADGDGQHDDANGEGNQWDEEQAEQDAKENQRRMSVQEERQKDGKDNDMDDDQDGDNIDDDADNDQADDHDADDDIDGDDDNDDQNQQRKRKNPEEEEEEEEEDKDEEEEKDKKKIKKKKKKKRKKKKVPTATLR